MPKTNNPHPHFRYVYVDLPVEWREAIDKGYKEFAKKEIDKGNNPCKTDFVRHIFKFYLDQNGDRIQMQTYTKTRFKLFAK